MQLYPDEAAKFWPTCRDYDAELTKVNDLQIANIREYANSYKQLTDAKADQLIGDVVFGSHHGVRRDGRIGPGAGADAAEQNDYRAGGYRGFQQESAWVQVYRCRHIS